MISMNLEICPCHFKIFMHIDKLLTFRSQSEWFNRDPSALFPVDGLLSTVVPWMVVFWTEIILSDDTLDTSVLCPEYATTEDVSLGFTWQFIS